MLSTEEGREKIIEGAKKIREEKGPLPDRFKPYWEGRIDDPRQHSNYCGRQSMKTPAKPWHNSDPCLACGKSREERSGTEL